MVFDFLPGTHVPHGFEIILADNILSPGSKRDIRNLWWDVQLTDDPRAWDEEIPSKNYSLRGERNDSKVWLAGYLLKTLKSNQRWHPGEELIDSFPGSIYWLTTVGF